MNKRNLTALAVFLFAVVALVAGTWGVRNESRLSQHPVLVKQKPASFHKVSSRGAPRSISLEITATASETNTASDETIPAESQAVASEPETQQPTPDSSGDWHTAYASWYGSECYGNPTADGTIYGPDSWGVAHRALPLGTVIEIRYGGAVVQAPVFDRGPFVYGREFDLSAAVARALGFSGVQEIEWRLKDE